MGASNKKKSDLAKIPNSDLTATLEVLARLGITQEDFANIRKDNYVAELVAMDIKQSYEEPLQRGDWCGGDFTVGGEILRIDKHSSINPLRVGDIVISNEDITTYDGITVAKGRMGIILRFDRWEIAQKNRKFVDVKFLGSETVGVDATEVLVVDSNVLEKKQD